MVTDSEQHQIIRQIRSGEQRQVEAAARDLRRRARETVTKIVRIGGSEEDINTILNDTVLDLIEMLQNGTYDPDRSPIGGLVYTIVKNKWMDELKKRYKKKEFESEYTTDINSAKNGRHNPVEIHLFTEEERQRIAQVLKKLKVADRELIEQKYLEGVSLQAIAKKLGISEDAVKKRHERCKKKLKKILGQDPRMED